MQKDQFCNLTRDIRTPGLLLKFQVATYMQLVGWEWTIFDFFNSYLALGLGGIKQKMYYSLLSLKMTSFVLFPQASRPSMNFIISELVYCPARKFFWFQFLFVPYQSSRWNPQPLVTALCTHYPTPTPTPLPHLEDLISILPK